MSLFVTEPPDQIAAAVVVRFRAIVDVIEVEDEAPAVCLVQEYLDTLHPGHRIVERILRLEIWASDSLHLNLTDFPVLMSQVHDWRPLSPIPNDLVGVETDRFAHMSLIVTELRDQTVAIAGRYRATLYALHHGHKIVERFLRLDL
jgi:hypothetical protein